MLHKSGDGDSAPEVVPSDLPERAPGRDYEGKMNISETYAEQEELLGGLPALEQYPPKERRICGIAARTFWVLVLLIVVILAAAIGGGIGGGLAAQNKNTTSSPAPQSNTDNTTTSNASSTSSPTNTNATSSASIATNTSPSNTSNPTSTSAPVPQYYSGCNSTDGSTYTPQTGNSPYVINSTALSYRIYCYKNFNTAAPGSSIHIGALPGAGPVSGLSTLDQCITECARYNSELSATRTLTWGELCSGAVYWNSTPTTTCWLQSGTRADAASQPWSFEIRLCPGAVYWSSTPSTVCWLQNGTTANAASQPWSFEIVTAVLQWPIS